MKAEIFIDKDRIGKTDLNIIDESMGVLRGQVTALPDYEKYRSRVQQETDSKGGANVEIFPFRIVSGEGSVLQAQGGITLIDSPEFVEFFVEVAGIDLSGLHV